MTVSSLILHVNRRTVFSECNTSDLMGRAPGGRPWPNPPNSNSVSGFQMSVMFHKEMCVCFVIDIVFVDI